MSFSPEKGFFIIVYNEAIINICYNFLLLFPSSFKEFLVAYTPVFFSCFYSTGIFEGTIPFIDLKDRFDREGVLEISQRVILTDSSYTPSVISPRPRRGEVLPVKTASLTGCSPATADVRCGCVTGDFTPVTSPDIIYKYPYDQ
jgi:hypothetical protein